MDFNVTKQFAIPIEQEFLSARELLNRIIKAIANSISIYIGYHHAIGKML